MKKLLDKIEQEVIEELKLKFPEEDGTNSLIIQVATISAIVTKSFIEKYENEKSS